MNKIRWGLLSTANINRRIIPAIRASQRGLVAIASRNQASADAYATKWEIPQAFDSYQAMLYLGTVIEGLYQRTQPPARRVVDPQPECGRGGAVRKAFCTHSRPRSTPVAEAAQVQTAGEWLRRSCTAITRRLSWQSSGPRSGRLGDLTVVRAAFNFKIDKRTDVRLQPSLGGGCLWDVGVYPTSFAQAVLGGTARKVVGDQWIGDTGVTRCSPARCTTPTTAWRRLLARSERLSSVLPRSSVQKGGSHWTAHLSQE